MNTLPENAHAHLQNTEAIALPVPESNEPESQQETTTPIIPVEESAKESTNKAAEDDAKRAEHEASEAKRKAEWDAKQQAKKAAEQEQINQLMTMNDSDVMMAAISRIGADTEKLTRRNMKDCVSEHIQTLSLSNPEFARLTMHPRKNMIHCFWFINRKAREFVKQEMKDNDIKPENGVYGSDIPDDMCYHWAEEYFRTEDAPEDTEKEDKFVPKTYSGKPTSKSKAKKADAKKPEKSTEKKPPAEEQLPFPGQFSLFDTATEVKAG